MSNNSFFEVYTEGTEDFTIDTSKYAQGRSGRHLPRSLTFTLLGYRYRPATPSCALFPPRLIVSSQNAFDTSGQVVLNEVGSRRKGASVALIGRTADSASQCVDSAACGFPFVIEVSDSDGGFPTSIVVSVSDGSILPNTIAISAAPASLPIRSSSDLSIKKLMEGALIGKTYGYLNALALPIAMGSGFFTPTALSLAEQIYGAGVSEDFMLGSIFHEYHALAAPIPINARSLVSRPPIWFTRTVDEPSPNFWNTGGLAYAVVFGGANTTWVNDLLQKGAALSFFYRVHSVSGDDTSPLVIQRFDVYIGDLLDPTSPTYPATVITGAKNQSLVSLYRVYVLPNTDPLITPTTTNDGLITDAVVLPITRKEKSSFAGTFNLSFDY
jgi:hypothetical protein